ncbi:MAG: response regulator transcription factor [Anaerolineales bacterium]|nr:response regulator transcription factor [Anaerolineales bacterium]
MYFSKTSREPFRILIVDDSPSVRESLGWLLQAEAGLTVAGDAANGADAISQVSKLKPDVVILDIELPDTDGFTVTRQLKALSNPPLVVLLSIHSDTLSKQRATEAGCDAFVEKGLGWPKLLSTLKKILTDSNQISNN